MYNIFACGVTGMTLCLSKVLCAVVQNRLIPCMVGRACGMYLGSIVFANVQPAFSISAYIPTSLHTGPYPQVPTVTFTNANANTLTLSWPSEDPTCSAITYAMTTSGCGSCSIATNMTTATATCTGLQLGNVCNFSVQSVICGFTGMPSNTESLAIKGNENVLCYRCVLTCEIRASLKIELALVHR